MSDYKKCPNCGSMLDLVSDVRSNTHGKVYFRSWLCQSCGVRQETRQIGTEAEETLLVSAPRAVIDASVQDRMEQKSLGHAEFQSIGGRRHLERQHA